MLYLVDELAARLYWRRMPSLPRDIAGWYGAPFCGYATGAVRELLTGSWQLRPAVFATVSLVHLAGPASGEAQSAVCAIRLRRPLPLVEVLRPPVHPLSHTPNIPAAGGYPPELEVRAFDQAAAAQVLTVLQEYLLGCEPGWYFRTSGVDLLSWWPVCEVLPPGVPPTRQAVTAPPVSAATVQWRLDRMCDLAELLGA